MPHQGRTLVRDGGVVTHVRVYTDGNSAPKLRKQAAAYRVSVACSQQGVAYVSVVALLLAKLASMGRRPGLLAEPVSTLHALYIWHRWAPCPAQAGSGRR